MSGQNRKDIHNSDIPVVCQSCEARHKGVCGAMTPEQLTHLSKFTNVTNFDRDKELVPAGEDFRNYANVLRGVVKLTKLMADGRQQIVGLQFAPDFLGRPFRRQSDVAAEAATDVKICTFPKTVLDEIVRNSPELEHRLHEQSLKELDEAREWLLTLGRKSASEKVASFLYLIALHIDPEAENADGAVSFELPLKRADIADFLGLTVETVSRQLTRLRKTGVIHLEHNRQVTIPDMELLYAASEQVC